MKNDILLSIIIPVHNGEKTVCNLLKSIIEQSIVNNIEIIIVDDNSSDRTLSVIKKMMHKCSATVICISNDEKIGAMQSRLRGFTLSHAPYILFADADDKILGKNSLEKALLIAQQNNFDIVHGHTISVIKGTGRREEVDWTSPIAKRLNKQELFYTFFSAKLYPPIHLWAKIFSRELFQKVYDKAKNIKIYRFDDKFLMSLAIYYANSYMHCDEYIYEYQQSEGMHFERYPARLHDFYKIINIMRPLLDNISDYKAKKSYLDFMQRRISYNIGKFCIDLEKNINIENQSYFFDWIYQYIDINVFLNMLLFSIHSNLDKIYQIDIKINKILLNKSDLNENANCSNIFQKYSGKIDIFSFDCKNIKASNEEIKDMIYDNALLAKTLQNVFHIIL